MQIPKIKLIPQPEREEDKNIIGYKWNSIVGTRHFLGGRPEGITESEFPKCKECNNPMTFYAQIDSIGDQYDLADCMVIHNYVCFGCFTVHSRLVQL